MIAILWRYEVPEAHRAAFEAAYGPEGDWARLFARTPGFGGTELLIGEPGHYMTIDRWAKASDFDAFLAAHGDAYRAMDARCEGWTTSEEKLGVFRVG